MSRVIWELRVEGTKSEFEQCIRTFDNKREAIEYVNAVRDIFPAAVGEPVNFWLHAFRMCEIAERLNG